MNNKVTIKITLIIICIVVINSVQCVFADDQYPIDTSGSIYTWTDNAKIEVDNTSSPDINISFTAENTVDGYNYGTVSSIFPGAYTSQSIFKSDYAAIAINIENKGNCSASINLLLTDLASNIYELKQDAFVMIENGVEKYMIPASYKSIKLAEGFAGKIIIPLSMFENNQKNAGKFDLNKLTSWSIGFLTQGKSEASLCIHDLSWMSEQYINKYASSFSAYIAGYANVQIPEHGESIADYVIKSNIENSYMYVTEDLGEGIQLTKDGRLTLTTKAKEQDLNIKAVDENGVTINKSIKLKNSWRKGDSKSFFYGPEELESIHYAFEGVSNSQISNIRIVLIIGCSVVFLSYVIFYARYKHNKRKGEDD